MNRLALLLFACVLLLSVSGSLLAASTTYQNPVFEPVFADPTIIRAEDGWFYAYGTEDDWGDGHGSRLLPIIRSQELVTWEYVGDAFSSKPAWKSSGYLWAPHIDFYTDQYYLFYSMSLWGDSNPGIGVATAPNPAGPFTDQGKLFDSESIGTFGTIDPFFIVDEDVPYLFWGSFYGIFGIELSKDGLRAVGEKFQIAGTAFEAPYIIKRDGYYYFFGSLGSCCEGDRSGYHVKVGRAESLFGPYLDRSGDNLFFSGITQGETVVVGHYRDGEGTQFAGPGHNSVIRDDAGTDWLVYHAVDKAKPWLKNGATRRPLLIDPLVWEDGWPHIQGLVPSNASMPSPVFD